MFPVVPDPSTNTELFGLSKFKAIPNVVPVDPVIMVAADFCVNLPVPVLPSGMHAAWTQGLITLRASSATQFLEPRVPMDLGIDALFFLVLGFCFFPFRFCLDLFELQTAIRSMTL